MLMLSIVLFIYGAIAGSFLNAFVYRLRSGGDKISDGRSKCDECGHELAAKDLIPLFSWLSQAGKCRYCKKKLSKLHPVFEFVSGLVFVLVGVFWPHDLSGALDWLHIITFLLLAANLLALSLYDILDKEIPFIFQYFNMGFGVALTAIGYYLERSIFTGWLDMLLGVVVLFGGFLFIHNVSDGKWLGGADVYLVAPFGLILGLQKGLLSLALASYVALGVIILLKLVKHKLHKEIPFGPFLSAGFVIAFFYGARILDYLI